MSESSSTRGGATNPRSATGDSTDAEVTSATSRNTVVDTTDEPTESAWSRARKRLSEAGAQVSASVNDRVDDMREQRERRAELQADAANAPAVAGSGSGATVTRRTRKARLRLARLDPWSVMKTMLLFSVAGAIVFFVATWVVWGVINASGVFDSVNKAVNDLAASPGSESTFRLEDYVNTHRILGLSALIGALDVVLLTALATLGAFLYNLAATVMGGLEVTLAED